MNARHHNTAPYWAEFTGTRRFTKLGKDVRGDVVVVGGGITGLTTAYLLASAGKSVIVLDRDRCAANDTGHTSAHLTMVTDVRLSELKKRFGPTHAQATWDAGLAAIDQIDGIVRAHHLDAGFEWVDSYLHAPVDDCTDEQVRALRDDADLAESMGFDVEYVSEVPLANTPGIRVAGQARIHPRKYLAGVAQAFTALGGRIFEQSEAANFCDEPLSVTANGHTVACDDIVLATHNPLVGISSLTASTLFQTKLALYTSYVIAGTVAKDVVPDALWSDTADPYRYLRVEPHADHDLVIFGGEDHKTGQVSDTEECYRRLEQRLTALISGVTPTHRWSGQVVETPDGLPYIGRSAEHQYCATGYAGNGLTFGTLAGMMIADAILERPNPWTELFDPQRKAVARGLWEYLKENADYPYYLIRDRFAGVEGQSLRVVKRGQGKVIARAGAKVAAYRSPAGAVTLRSATCPHMGCTVAWNPAERTWDCPCHGSRFKPNGQVISGPAESPLAEIE